MTKVLVRVSGKWVKVATVRGGDAERRELVAAGIADRWHWRGHRVCVR